MKAITDFTAEGRQHLRAKMPILIYPLMGIMVLAAMTLGYYLFLGYGFLWVLLSG
jgi:hypothetical protein